MEDGTEEEEEEEEEEGDGDDNDDAMTSEREPPQSLELFDTKP